MFFVFISLFVFPVQAEGQTFEELQAQIQQMIKAVSSLQEKIGLMRAPVASHPVQAPQTTLPAYDFKRSLTMGSIGEDVRELQKFLNSKGFRVADFGAGSPGNESIYFGSKTRNALSRFQLAESIMPVSGFFGPFTISKVVEIMNNQSRVKTGEPSKPFEEGRIDFSVITQGAFRGYEKEENLVIRDFSKWKEVWDYLHTHLTFVPNPPFINFKDEMILAVFSGEKPTGGYSAEISEVSLKNNVLKVVVVNKVPASGQIVTQVNTRPHSIVKLPAFEGRVEFEIIEEEIQIFIPSREQEEKKDVIEPVEFELFDAQVSNSYNREESVVIRDFSEWVETWRKIHSHISIPPDPLPFDFNEEMLIALFLGEKTKSGHSIEVTEVEKFNDILKIKALKKGPGIDCFAAQFINHPYVIIRLDRFEGEIDFEIQDFMLSC